MFTNLCSHCHQSQLIFPSQITSIADGANGPVVSYTCWCGSAQTWSVGETADPARVLQVA